MEKSKLFIPDNILVGYQERKDTYTKKLAFVVFKDNKGIIRKQKSWDQWRHKSINPDTFDNTPTSGFVLNKKVGETRYGWNPRMAWVRIFDPRGFEFEITVSNLLFILEETSSVKGKGLEGEFVYAWDNTNLVLLPVTSNEYTKSCNYTSMQSKKINKDMILEGREYITKKQDRVLYLGKHNFFTFQYYNYTSSCKIGHIFCLYDKKNNYTTPKFIVKNNFSHIAEIVSEDISPYFADAYTEFKNGINGSEIVNIDFVETPNTIREVLNIYHHFHWVDRLVFFKNNYMNCYIYNKPSNKDNVGIYEIVQISKDPLCIVKNRSNINNYLTIDVDQLKTYCIELTLGSGKKITF